MCLTCDINRGDPGQASSAEQEHYTHATSQPGLNLKMTSPKTCCNKNHADDDHVGIVALQVYFPKSFVEQAELEVFEKVSPGKFTKGLGQERMAFVNDREDIYSICLTAVQSLLEAYQISPDAIGWLEVGTETIIDHSKSVKSVLMQLFGDNTDIEGVDSVHACYGATAALFNACAWVQSTAWDGRYALVVAADIAEYASGPARPTGGVGAVAMLIGKGAVLRLDGPRASHMQHAYDFYKPNLSSPYPVVDGHFSNLCYLNSLDTCYARYRNKIGHIVSDFRIDRDSDYVVFHAPYNKLVQKSYARLVYNDFVANPDDRRFDAIRDEARGLDSKDDRRINEVFGKFAADDYARQAGPCTLLPRQIGNMYAASLYAGLASLVSNAADQLPGKRVVMFSYGSGLASSMFSFRVATDAADRLQSMKQALNLAERLQQRQRREPAVLEQVLTHRDKVHTVTSFTPTGSLEWLFPGSYYLTNKDSKSRRFYERHR